MPTRRRYATRDELAAELHTRRGLPADQTRAVLDALARLGVPVDQLVKIEVDERVTWPGDPLT